MKKSLDVETPKSAQKKGMAKVTVKEVTVAQSDHATSNMTFISKGYSGPFHCLARGCGWVLTEDKEKAPRYQATQRNLLTHWTETHGEVRDLLFYDQSSASVLNVKVVLNNVGTCAHPGCEAVLYASKRGDFSNTVAGHWGRHHADEAATVSKANLVRVISEVPLLTQQEALRRVNLALNNEKCVNEPAKISIDLEEESLVEDSDDDDEDEDEEETEFDGPYKCSQCPYQLSFSMASSRLMLKHWVSKHSKDVRQLVFLDTPTGCEVRAEHLFQQVARCRAPDCGQVIGNNGLMSALYRRARQHWAQCHGGEDKLEDRDKVELLFTEEAERGGVVCEVAGCGWRQLTSVEGWRQECFNHFLLRHDYDLGQLRFRRESDGAALRVQQLFSQVGQCAQEDCHMIRTSNSRQSSALTKLFTEHYKMHHPAAKQETFTHLVLNGKVKFVTEGADQDTEVEFDNDNLVCAKCGKKVKKTYLFNHWNSQHKGEHISSCRIQCNTSKQLLDVTAFFSYIGQCRVASCGHYFGANSLYHPLARVAKEHFNRVHGDTGEEFDEARHYSEVLAPGLGLVPEVDMNTDTTEDKEQEVEEETGPLQCSVCLKTLDSAQPPLQHWMKHGRHPASLRLVRARDQASLGLKQLYRWIFRCEADCQYWAVSNTSARDCETKLRDHWARSHNASCSPRYSQVDTLGYTCGLDTCDEVMETSEMAAEHFRHCHPDTPAAEVTIVSLDTGARLGLDTVYSWRRSCAVAHCSYFSCSNISRAEVDRSLDNHVDTCHGDVATLSLGEGSGAGEYQCMHGADEHGDVTCPATVAGTSLAAEAVQHWTRAHPGQQLRDLVFINTATGVFTQISDLFSHVLVCQAASGACGHVVYTNSLESGRAALRQHASQHSSKQLKALDNGTEMLTADFLGLNIAVTSEEADTAEAAAEPEVVVEALEITGYTCGVAACSKTVKVSRNCNPTAALNRLKTHFNKVHTDLDSGSFSYDTRYDRDVDNAVNVSVEVAGAEEEVRVYQCPAAVKGGRQCPELAMDTSSLRIHWGSQHSVMDQGAEFLPLELSIEAVSHYACCVPACTYKHLSVKQVRGHWEAEHRDHPARFQVVHNRVRILTSHNTNTPPPRPASAKVSFT